jgi:hypothetical protein
MHKQPLKKLLMIPTRNRPLGTLEGLDLIHRRLAQRLQQCNNIVNSRTPKKPRERKNDSSCFSNAILQCLFQVAPLRAFFTVDRGDVLSIETYSWLSSKGTTT